LEYFWYEFGDPAEIYQWIEMVLTQENNLPPHVRATALRFMGYVLMTMQIDYPRAQMFFEAALQLWLTLDNPAETVNTLSQLGIVALELGHFKRSQSLYEECLRISESLGDAKGMLWDREWLSIVAMRQGQPQKAQQVFEESAQWWRKQADLQSEAFALNNLGVAAMYVKDYARARGFQEKALGLSKTIGDLRGVSAILNALGPVALHQGHAAEAYTFLSESLSLRWEHQDYNGIAWNLERLGEVAFAQAEWTRGAQLWGAAEALREKYHSPLFPAEQERYQAVLAAAHRQLGETGWSVACAAGHAAPIEEIVKYALEKPAAPNIKS
jgi:tetratricopeptide (TPR) repeat protein